MAHSHRPTLFSISIFLVCFLFLVSPALANRTIQVTPTPQSGVAPLEVKIRVAVATNTSAPSTYIMDFGDGGEPETVESSSYSHTFTHTYAAGYYKPVCTVEKSAGLTTVSDPSTVIVGRWRFVTGDDVDSSPAIGPDGTVYVGSDDGYLYAVDPETGVERWRFPAVEPVRSSPAVGPDGSIYFGAGVNLYGLSPAGAMKWALTMGDAVYSSPALGADGRVLYVGAGDNALYAVNATGTVKWRFQAGNKIVSSPAIGHDGLEPVVYVGSLDRHVYALAADNGALKWKFQTNAEVYGSPAVGSDGTIYVGECKTGSAETYNFKFFCLNVDGSKRWEYSGGTGFYSSPAIGGQGLIYVGAWDGYLFALNTAGAKSWSVRTSPPSDINSSPAVGANEVIYVGCKDGNFYAFQSQAVEAAKREDWVFQTGDSIHSSPVIDGGGTIYFGSRDNCLYAVNPGNATPAISPWPMFRRNPSHAAEAGAVTLPSVLSASPERNAAGVLVGLEQVLVNFSPSVKSEQIDIASFRLEKETESGGKEALPGTVNLDWERYNNSAGYHAIAVFKQQKGADPLAHGATYHAAIHYRDTLEIPEAEEGQEINPYDKTFSWSFTTEAEPQQDGGDGDGGEIGCFIGVILKH